MAQDYVITGTQPYTYLDQNSQVVNGFRVFFSLTAFNEAHFVLVPSLNPEVVKTEIGKLVKQRKDLSTQ
jgi:hypothetical protein